MRSPVIYNDDSPRSTWRSIPTPFPIPPSSSTNLPWNAGNHRYDSVPPTSHDAYQFALMFYPPPVILALSAPCLSGDINPPSTSLQWSFNKSSTNQQLQSLLCPTRSTHHPVYCSERTSARAALLRRVVRSPLASRSIQPLLIYQYRLQAIVLPDIRSTHHPLFTMVHDSPPILIHTDHFQIVSVVPTPRLSHQLIHHQTSHPTA